MIGQNFISHNELSLSSDGSTRSSDCSQPEISTSRVIATTVTKIFIPRNTGVGLQSTVHTNSLKDVAFSVAPKQQALQKNMIMQQTSLLTPITPPRMTQQKLRLKSPTRMIVPHQIQTKSINSPAVSFLTQSTHSYHPSLSTISSSTASVNSIASPTKLYIRHPVPGQQIQVSGNKTMLPAAPASGTSVQPLRMVGNKIQYLRLVTPPSSSTQSGMKIGSALTTAKPVRQIAPSGVTMATSPSLSTSQPIKITMPVQQLMAKGACASGPSHNQRVLLPNTLPVRPASSHSLTHLPPGTTILSSGSSNLQSYALVSTQIVPQAEKPATPMQLMMSNVRTQTVTTHTLTSPLSAITHSRNEFVPITATEPTISDSRTSSLNGNTIEATGARPRKPCNCTKSQCLKLYCDCFANGEFCHNCNCNNCANNLRHESERSRAIKSCLDRNPMAFHPKIGKGKVGESDYRRHNKGCNCKRSGCLKNYCECYEAKIMCSNTCKCVGCKNYEESPERKTLMHLADAAEVRVLQQTAAKHKLSTQMQDLPSRHMPSQSGERLPYTFVTTDVAEATCACLLAQAEEAEKYSPVVQERMVIEEFGRCLLQIIESANRTKHVNYMSSILDSGVQGVKAPSPSP